MLNLYQTLSINYTPLTRRKNKESDRMTNKHQFLFFALAITLLTASCAPDDYSQGFVYGGMSIWNNSGHTLYIRTNLISENVSCDSLLVLKDFDDASICLTGLMDGPIRQLTIEEMAENMESGVVDVFQYKDSLTLVKQWTYTDRAEPGRQLFNEEYLEVSYHQQSRHASYDRKKAKYTYCTFYSFTILPSDVE